jgi:uncharacterized protein (DUF1778 family)
MAKTRFTSSETVHSVTRVIMGHPSAIDANSSINLRIDANAHQFTGDAVAVLDKTRIEAMLLDRCLFRLGPVSFEAFTQALENPPAPGPKLKALLRRNPAWQE